ncbi:MAG: sarcosine oxidase subunit gamma [Octadecabacter sp.]|nr:sarcosine oxidase subunit gamma [Octadecabacter sp.]
MSDRTKVARLDARGMITLRGDLGAPKLIKVVKAVTGQGVPPAGAYLGDRASGVAWMSPDELLLMVPYAQVAENLAALDAALAGSHYLAVDVSDARAVFTVEGARAREALARLCPVDFHVDAFKAGDFRRTRMAQIVAAVWMHEGGFGVVCFRSVADYAESILRNAAEGALVGVLGK